MRGLGPASPRQQVLSLPLGQWPPWSLPLRGRQAAGLGRWAGHSARLTQLGVGLGSGPLWSRPRLAYFCLSRSFGSFPETAFLKEAASSVGYRGKGPFFTFSPTKLVSEKCGDH